METKNVTLKLAGDAPGIGRSGEVVTLALTPTDVRLPEELPTYLAGYAPAGFRCEDALPEVLVDESEFYHRSFTLKNTFQQIKVKTGLTGAVPEVDPETTTTSAKVQHRSLGSFIPVLTEKESRFNARQAAMERIKRATMLDMEVDCWNSTNGTIGLNTNFAAANRYATVAGEQWNGGANSDPIAAIEARILASSQQVTDIWMNQQVAFTFLNHPLVKDKFKALIGDRGMADTIANVGDVHKAGSVNVDFYIPTLGKFHVVASKVYDETTAALDFILTDSVILTVNPPGGVPANGEAIATGYTFRLRGNTGVGWETREYWVEGRGRGGTMVVVHESSKQVMVGSTCGGIITNVIQ